MKFYRVQLLPKFKLSSVGRRADGIIEFVLEAPAGFRFGLEASDNLTDWSEIAVVTTTGLSTRIADPATSGAMPFRSYRAVLKP